MLTKEEIEAKLKGVDPKLCTIFAARCSLRVLPLLTHNNNGFAYWQAQERGQHLLALCHAVRYATNVNRAAAYAAADAAADAADAAAADAAAADAANAAVLAALAAAYAAYAADAADAADAAAAAA